METVLIIVPHDVEREALGTMLADEGYRVISARSVSEARTALMSSASAVVLDAATDGAGSLFDLFRSERREIPLIVLSADDYESRFVSAVAFLRKPFKPELLVSKIREWARPRPSPRRRAQGD